MSPEKLLLKIQYGETVKYVVVPSFIPILQELLRIVKIEFCIEYDAELIVCDKDGTDITNHLDIFIANFNSPSTVYVVKNLNHKKPEPFCDFFTDLLSSVKPAETPENSLNGSSEIFSSESSFQTPPIFVDVATNSKENAHSNENDSSNHKASNGNGCEDPLEKSPKILPPSGPKESLKVFLEKRNYNVKDIVTPCQQRGYISLVVDFLINNYGSFPKKEEKILVAKQAVALHPELKDRNNSEDYALLFDGESRSGPIEWRLKTVRTQRRREVRSGEIASSSASTASPPENPPDKLYDQKIDFLKKGSTDSAAIISASNDTAVERHKFILTHPEAKILVLFPRYFDFSPSLVLSDFEILYPQAQTLKSWWDSYSATVGTIFLDQAEKLLKCFEAEQLIDWNDDIKLVLKLFLLVKPTKLSLTPKFVAEFIRFKKSSIPYDEFMTSQDFDGKAPFILAQGPSKSHIDDYFVLVDHEKLPPVHSLIEALDLYFKAFFVFNITYPSSAKNFLECLEAFVYKINKDLPKRLAVRLRRIFSRLINLSD